MLNHAFKKRAGETRDKDHEVTGSCPGRTIDEDFLRPIMDQIAELGQKRREIDE